MLKIIETDLKPREPFEKRATTKYIVLHHAEAVHCTIQDINMWHKANGWSCCGYNYFVAKNGKIYRGRPEWAVGAQCKGFNSVSIGICAEGDYENKDKTMPKAQYDALVSLIHDIGTRYQNLEIKGHKELYPTECPGRFYPLEKLRK